MLDASSSSFEALVLERKPSTTSSSRLVATTTGLQTLGSWLCVSVQTATTRVLRSSMRTTGTMTWTAPTTRRNGMTRTTMAGGPTMVMTGRKMTMRSHGTSATTMSHGTMSLRMHKMDKPLRRTTTRKRTLAQVNTMAKVARARTKMVASTVAPSGIKSEIVHLLEKATTRAKVPTGKARASEENRSQKDGALGDPATRATTRGRKALEKGSTARKVMDVLARDHGSLQRHHKLQRMQLPWHG